MPPRSPTQAFDPTPALDHNHHFSPFNNAQRHFSMDDWMEHTTSKEVRFSEPPNSIHGRHSIATSNVPLLPPVSSASHVPKTAFRIMNPTPGVDITAYFEQCRNVNEQLRSAHDQERKAWEIERTALKTKIADLEFKLNKAKGTTRRSSNEASTSSSQSFRSDFRLNHGPAPHVNGFKPNSAPLGPTTHSLPPIWQPESPLPPSRIFANEDDIQHLPSISEDETGNDSNSLSPHTSRESVSIPIQQIDERLDGITVKSEGVRSSFNKVMSPIIISPSQSPEPKVSQDVPRLSLDSASLLDPLDEKLKRNAGHTPLIFEGNLSSTGTDGDITPREEKPTEPAPSTRPPLRPSENSDSYFSTDNIHLPEQAEKEDLPQEPISEEREEEPEPLMEPEDDKPMKGPLMLDSKGQSEASNVFLEKLDGKLADMIRESQNNTPVRSPDHQEVQVRKQDDDMPMLKLKKSTNFGSAYGMTMPGFA